MMKIISFVVIAVLILPLTFGEYIPYSLRVANPQDIETFIKDYISYEYYDHQRGLAVIWHSKKADCTGMSRLAKYFYMKRGIGSFISYGQALCNGIIVRHDWLVLDSGEVVDPFINCVRLPLK